MPFYGNSQCKILGCVVQKLYHVHDSTWHGFSRRKRTAATKTRSPTAMLDQLTPFWPGSAAIPIAEDGGRGDEGSGKD